MAMSRKILLRIRNLRAKVVEKIKIHILLFDFMFKLNALFVYYIYHIPLHVSSNVMLIIRRIHCIHTASGSLYVNPLR